MTHKTDWKEQFKEEKKNEWRETVSGQIFARLQKIAEREKKEARIDWPGEVVEKFWFGNESATILKHLEGGTVGLEDGAIASYAESWEYRNLPWWKEALDAEEMPVGLLDTPLTWVARDAGVENPAILFRPPSIIETYKLVSADSSTQDGDLKEWLRSRIIAIIAPLVEPNYTILFSDGSLRLVAQTEEAKASLKIDNDTYAQALLKIKEAVPLLDAEWKQKALESI